KLNLEKQAHDPARHRAGHRHAGEMAADGAIIGDAHAPAMLLPDAGLAGGSGPHSPSEPARPVFLRIDEIADFTRGAGSVDDAKPIEEEVAGISRPRQELRDARFRHAAVRDERI